MDERPVKNRNELHKEVLGGIVTTNGFFTGAVFLSVTGAVTPMPGIPSNCVAGEDMTFKLFLFQLWSIGFYLTSSLIAMAAKLIVVYFDTDPSGSVFNILLPSTGSPPWRGCSGDHDAHHPGSLATILAPYVRPVMILSVLLSAVGSSLLLLSVVNLVQIKIGLMSCGSPLVVTSVVVIALLIALGLGVYLVISWFVFKYVK